MRRLGSRGLVPGAPGLVWQDMPAGEAVAYYDRPPGHDRPFPPQRRLARLALGDLVEIEMVSDGPTRVKFTARRIAVLEVPVAGRVTDEGEHREGLTVDEAPVDIGHLGPPAR